MPGQARHDDERGLVTINPRHLTGLLPFSKADTDGKHLISVTHFECSNYFFE